MTAFDWIRHRKHFIITGAMAAALSLTPSARAQTPYTTTFRGMPAAASCDVDTINTTTATSTIRLQSYDAAGDQVSDVTTPVPASGALRANLNRPDLFGNNRANIAALTVSSASPSSSTMTCILTDTMGHTAGYTVPPDEFGSLATLFSIASPAAGFPQDPTNPVQWTNTLIAGNMGDQNLTLSALTTPRSTTSGPSIGYIAQRGLPSRSTISPTIDDLFSVLVQENANDGLMRATGADGTTPVNIAAHQVLRGTDGSIFALHAPFEDAVARELYFTHVFAPVQASANNWHNLVAIRNTSINPTAVYVTPYDGQGNKLGDVVLTINPEQTYVGAPQDLFKDLPNSATAAWAQARSKELVAGVELFQYGSIFGNAPQVLAVNAATNLDVGTTILAPRAQAGVGQASTYVLLNPGSRDEQVEGDAIDANGRTVATATFTIPHYQHVVANISDVFPNADVSSASYVVFHTTTPAPTGPTSISPSAARIAGLTMNATYTLRELQIGWFTIPVGFQVHMEAATMQNIDALRTNIEVLDPYNPRNGTSTAEIGDGPSSVVATVIARDRDVASITYDPKGAGDFTKNYAAAITNPVTSRRLYGTAMTADGMVLGDAWLPSYTNDAWAGQGTRVALNTSINVKATDASAATSTTSFTTPLTVVQPENYDVNYLIGKGYTRTTIKADPTAYATILYNNRAGYTDPAMQNVTLDRFISGYVRVSADSTPYTSQITDVTFSKFDLSTGDAWAITDVYGDGGPLSAAWSQVQKTPAGAQLMKQARRFFQFPQDLSAYAQPEPGTIIAIPPNQVK